MASRKDNKDRVLQKGEAQRTDGRYQFAFTDLAGKRRFLYADNLVDLRKKEREYYIADWQGASQFGSRVSLNYMYDRMLALKCGIKESTYASYRQSMTTMFEMILENSLLKTSIIQMFRHLMHTFTGSIIFHPPVSVIYIFNCIRLSNWHFRMV